jgi:hypothetical protein
VAVLEAAMLSGSGRRTCSHGLVVINNCQKSFSEKEKKTYLQDAYTSIRPEPYCRSWDHHCVMDELSSLASWAVVVVGGDVSMV